jgi:hypothetical protein
MRQELLAKENHPPFKQGFSNGSDMGRREWPCQVNTMNFRAYMGGQRRNAYLLRRCIA